MPIIPLSPPSKTVVCARAQGAGTTIEPDSGHPPSSQVASSAPESRAGLLYIDVLQRAASRILSLCSLLYSRIARYTHKEIGVLHTANPRMHHLVSRVQANPVSEWTRDQESRRRAVATSPSCPLFTRCWWVPRLPCRASREAPSAGRDTTLLDGTLLDGTLLEAFGAAGPLPASPVCIASMWDGLPTTHHACSWVSRPCPHPRAGARPSPR